MNVEQFVIQVEDGQCVNHPVAYDNFLSLFPNCPREEMPTNDVIAPYGYEVFIITPKPQSNIYEHEAVEGPYVKMDGIWTNSWTITPYTEQEISIAKWNKIRLSRNLNLRLCDWTQLTGVDITSEERMLWDTYRQTLRDIPQTFATPEEVIFPVVPANNSMSRPIF